MTLPGILVKVLLVDLFCASGSWAQVAEQPDVIDNGPLLASHSSADLHALLNQLKSELDKGNHQPFP